MFPGKRSGDVPLLNRSSHAAGHVNLHFLLPHTDCADTGGAVSPLRRAGASRPAQSPRQKGIPMPKVTISSCFFPEKLQRLSSPRDGPPHAQTRCLPCARQGNKVSPAAAASRVGPGAVLAQEGAASRCFPTFPGQRGLAVTLVESFIFLRP